MPKFTVYVKETTLRPLQIVADTPADAERIAEEIYLQSDVVEVDFDTQTGDNTAENNKSWEGY